MPYLSDHQTIHTKRDETLINLLKISMQLCPLVVVALYIESLKNYKPMLIQSLVT